MHEERREWTKHWNNFAWCAIIYLISGSTSEMWKFLDYRKLILPGESVIFTKIYLFCSPAADLARSEEAIFLHGNELSLLNENWINSIIISAMVFLAFSIGIKEKFTLVTFTLLTRMYYYDTHTQEDSSAITTETGELQFALTPEK